MREEDRFYRSLIDELVRACKSGQGQCEPSWIRRGEWPDHEVKAFLARTSATDREIIVRMVEQAFIGGVHSALVTPHEREVPPFDEASACASEGTPFHDFVGRLAGWEWPER